MPHAATIPDPVTSKALIVDDVAKTFHVPRQHVSTLKERALHPFRRTEYIDYEVLKGITFDVAQGEFFGIVGRNGSGKSTLLKCMAGIYRLDRGSIATAGRVAPFIELGVGFNMDLTAYENVVINGVMMGLSRREATRRFDEIMEFAELGDFLDLKLKNYSSGMQVRLAFSVMVQSDADVFLIDEVLAVGDAAFQQKCLDVFYRLRDIGKTIVLVTHDMSAVERFCHRAMFIRDGVIEQIGEPIEIGGAYIDANFEHGPSPEDVRPDVSLDAWKANAYVVDEHGERVLTQRSGEPVRIAATITPPVDVEYPSCSSCCGIPPTARSRASCSISIGNRSTLARPSTSPSRSTSNSPRRRTTWACTSTAPAGPSPSSRTRR